MKKIILSLITMLTMSGCVTTQEINNKELERPPLVKSYGILGEFTSDIKLKNKKTVNGFLTITSDCTLEVEISETHIDYINKGSRLFYKGQISPKVIKCKNPEMTKILKVHEILPVYTERPSCQIQPT